ncbi:MAG: hypothetical protein H7174_06625 [Flavobacterium sp.]|nr:hypothetical protein [Flavobacterium sp.]
MKFIKLFSFFTVFAILFSFTACNTEPIDPNVNLNPTGNVVVVPVNPNIPVIPNPSGDYFPMQINNSWNYDNGTTIKNFKINSTEIFDGKINYKTNRAFMGYDDKNFSESDITSHIRKDLEKYYQRIFINRPEIVAKPATPTTPAVVGVPGVIVQPYTILFLKDNLAVGDTYNQVVPMSITTKTTTTQIINSSPTVVVSSISTTESVIYDITLVEKIQNIAVNGYFTTVLKIKTVSSATTDIIYTWYAKDIGIWKQTKTNAAGVVTNFQNLTTFDLL